MTSMEALIPIYQTAGDAPAVSARELHAFLESRQDFTNWIKGRIEKYGFVEGVDFSIILSRSQSNRQTTEYALSLDTAKELAMVEANAKGQQARRYFIEAEKQLQQQRPAAPAALSPAELILQLAQQNVQTEQRLLALERAVAETQARAITSDVSYYTVAGFASLHGRKLNPRQANEAGRRAARESRYAGYEVGKIHDARYGQVNTYHVEVLRKVFLL